MNEKLQKMLETLGIECKEGKMPDNVLEQLSEKWDASLANIQATAEPLKPIEGAPALSVGGLVLPKEYLVKTFGRELSGDELENLAKEGQEYRKQLIDDTMAMGVRAMGNDFPKETYETTFATMGTKAIKDIMKTFESQAMSIPAGRKSNPDMSGEQKFSIPDEAFRV